MTPRNRVRRVRSGSRENSIGPCQKARLTCGNVKQGPKGSDIPQYLYTHAHAPTHGDERHEPNDRTLRTLTDPDVDTGGTR